MQIAEMVQQDIDGLVQKHRSIDSEKGSAYEKIQDWLSSIDPSADPPKKHRRTMTWDKLQKHLSQGFGMGHGAEYRPWLILRRKNPSKTSNQVAAHLFPLRREACFFSRGEYQIALLLLWLGVEDLREQYPLWPIAHPHPLYGVLETDGANTQYCSGLLDIAQLAGIDHGVYPGTDIPYVATIDFLLTVRIKGELRLVAISCKPLEDPNSDIKWRVLERLELERRYAESNGILYYVYNSRLVPILMAGQLEWCIDLAFLDDIQHLVPFVERFATEFESIPGLAIADAVVRASEICNLSMGDGWTVFRHCAWTQKVDIDLSQPILTSYPANRGGRALRAELRRTLISGWVS